MDEMTPEKCLSFCTDALGCHWCKRQTQSLTEGHDGMCPVPVLEAARICTEALDKALRAWEADLDRIEALEKDAKRYRWLRDGNAYCPEEQEVTGGDDLDALCDAAIAAPEKTYPADAGCTRHVGEPWPCPKCAALAARPK